MRVWSYGHLWAWLGVYVVIVVRCEGFLFWSSSASVVQIHQVICGYAGDSLPVRKFGFGNNRVRVRVLIGKEEFVTRPGIEVT